MNCTALPLESDTAAVHSGGPGRTSISSPLFNSAMHLHNQFGHAVADIDVFHDIAHTRAGNAA
ncbi:hypothetical protein BANRA_00001 [Klebsiella pneumoniae]|nr:hypothetical protein BANRA_00001 [Klebsiella pneumoniae]